MSCPHGNPIGDCDICDEIDAAFEAGRRSALAEQPAPAQEPDPDELTIAYMSGLREGKKRKPLTDEEIDRLREANSEGRGSGWRFNFKGFARAIEAAHDITKGNT